MPRAEKRDKRDERLGIAMTIRTGNTLVPIYTSEVKTVGQLN